MTKRLLSLGRICSVTALIFGLCTAGFSAEGSEKMNVVLLVLDQLRADRLHCYGNPRSTSPSLDRLAEEGVRFSRFFSVAPWTAPSYATMMTSQFPSRHGVTLFWRSGMPLLNEKVPVLAEAFKANGYRTAAFVNNGLAGKDLTGRGFDEYFEGQRSADAVNVTERLPHEAPHTAPATTKRLLAWLDQHRLEPFFLFVLFLEPHSPNDPPPEHDLFKSDAYPDQSDSGYDIRTGRLKRLAMLGDQKAIERLYQLYDGKIHFVDAYVGRLMEQLRKLHLEEKTLVAVTSDHGELMYSHPRDFLTFDHRSLYETVLHIPFILSGPPHLPRGKVIDALASNLDTAPTILHLADLPPLAGAQGQSLVPLIRERTQALNQYLYAEEDIAVPLRSIRNQRYKLIYNLWNNEKQVFNLEQDTLEQKDVAEQNPRVAMVLFGRLQEWMKENQPAEEKQKARWKVYTQPEKVLIVDDQTIGGRLLLTGMGWHSDESAENGHYAGACFWTEPGDGSRTAIWRGDNPLLGTYKVFVHYGRLPDRRLATKARFMIVAERSSKAVRVNFNRALGQWNPLGTFKNPRYVSLSNATDGVILVDAVKFERLD